MTELSPYKHSSMPLAEDSVLSNLSYGLGGRTLRMVTKKVGKNVYVKQSN